MHIQADPSRAFLDGQGEMATLARSLNWGRTSLGDPAGWPQSLKTAASLCLHSRFPMLIWWGRDLVMLYNDAYRPILGERKHPKALGQSGADCWPEIWELIGPMLHGVLDGQPATWAADQLLMLESNGFPEERYFTFSYSPIFDESGGVGGVFTAVTETTERVVNERRLVALANLGDAIGELRDIATIERAAVEALARDRRDNAFAALVEIGDSDLRELACAGEVPTDLLAAGSRAAKLCRAAAEGAPAAWTPEPGSRDRPWGALVAHPIAVGFSTGKTLTLVTALDKGRVDDDAYRGFLASAATRVGAAIEAARAHENEQSRLAALAELDRAKTTFFSNVSHELRTPLTLIIGPIEQFLAEREDHDELLATARRSAMRLRRLVNDLLDFSRLEAGRLRAEFEPTDVCEATTEIAALYRSTIESAGLRYDVRCEAQNEIALIDRSMWEKVVLNLVSNAFKFTHEGAIKVCLERVSDRAVLTVADTGVGIAPEDQARLFERFYRVADSKGRTDEGTGIGLALVKELVQLHGGWIEVTSELGRGTTFTVSIPLRDAQGASAAPWRSDLALPDPTPTASAQIARRPDAGAPTPGSVVRVLVVDDNDDMAAFLARLLSERWAVERARNGREALDAIRRSRPDVLVSDVMMPELDGFGLVRELRADPSTRSIPVILVSARAGDEARLEGLSSGADDYLTKPFSAPELIARVENQLMRRRLTDLDESTNRKLAEVFEHAHVGIILFSGPEHRVEFANPAYQALVPERRLAGRTIREIFPDLASQRIYDLLDGVYQTGQPFVGRSVELKLKSPETGEEATRSFDFVYQAMRGSDGVISGVVAVVFEVTELANARAEAVEANRAKDEFIAMLGHELRNPLSPISAALHLMRVRAPDALANERGIIERQVQHMVRLVNDLLDVARIARGDIELRKAPVEVPAIVADAVETASPLLEQKSHKLSLPVPAEGFKVFGDASRLTQIVANLLTNAAKFTPPGGNIAVEVRGSDGWVEITVRDDGIGIGPDDIDRVFQPFVQGRQDKDRSAGGLGLGLAIASNLARLHGGAVRARSDGRGAGSAFTIALPLAPKEPADPRISSPSALATAPIDGRAPSILVVDDNVDVGDSLAEVLRVWGFDVSVARDGVQAMAELRAAPRDFALLDIGLPAMDGYELASALRSEPVTSMIRLVAITGYGQVTDVERSKASGFDHHLVKPVDLVQLPELLIDLNRPGA